MTQEQLIKQISECQDLAGDEFRKKIWNVWMCRADALCGQLVKLRVKLFNEQCNNGL